MFLKANPSSSNHFDESGGSDITPRLPVLWAINGVESNLYLSPGARNDHGVAINDVRHLCHRQVFDSTFLLPSMEDTLLILLSEVPPNSWGVVMRFWHPRTCNFRLTCCILGTTVTRRSLSSSEQKQCNGDGNQQDRKQGGCHGNVGRLGSVHTRVIALYCSDVFSRDKSVDLSCMSVVTQF